jgi:2-polyprenyl-6-methoxyphenol hydroxylase-like FAD-dependent oxidoreductase
MVDSRTFRVIVGGGGISGLTLANALEKAGIEYILLEARDTIAPQVGASIGFSANGCRILDQLGCFDDIAQDTVPLRDFHNRYEDGSLIYTGDGIPLMQKRYVSSHIHPRTQRFAFPND